MKVLFTGASSFTGYWFTRALSAAGGEVHAIFRRQDVAGYDESVRRQRVALAREFTRPVFACSFGDARFLQAIREAGPFDVFCHHGAEVTNYHSPDFDVDAAVANNANNLAAVLEAMKETGCRNLVLTGSVFERGEGAGSDGLPSFSPYGESKALTYELFRDLTDKSGLFLGKFVIPNPFGPYEEPRFTNYLVQSWHRGEVPGVRTPAYVRDNIHVSLLAQVYAQYVQDVVAGKAGAKANPSGYIETQGEFAQRFAHEMSPRLNIPCELTLAEQTDFPEPLVRTNTQDARPLAPHWSESAAWDEVADFYAKKPTAAS
jgi:nucleoside-diphosphate-sugar epimerase